MIKLVKKINKVFYYGWVIVFVSALAFLFSSPGQTYSISLFISTYETELGYSKTLLSTGYSIATILSGSLLIFMGKATDRFGPRKMIIIAGVMLVIGSALGPLPFGVVFDLTGSFNPVIIGMMVMTIISMFLSLLITKPKKILC